MGLAATLLICGLWLLELPMLERWEWSTYDARMKSLPSSGKSSEIVLILRDEKSDERFGLGLWDREKFATVIAALGRAGAKVIVLGFNFSGESPTSRGGVASDAALVKAVRSAGNVIVPLLVERRLDDFMGMPVSTSDPLVQWLSRSSLRREGIAVSPGSGDTLKWLPLESMAQVAAGFGHIAAVAGEDSVYRHVPAFIDVQGHVIPALGIAAAAAYREIPVSLLSLNSGNELIFSPNEVVQETDKSLRVPLDGEGDMLVRYAGTSSNGFFTQLSFVEVYDGILNGREEELQKQVTGKIVLLGHHTWESKPRPTPLEGAALEGMVHANVIHTILSGQGLRPLSSTGSMAITLIIAMVVAWFWLSVSMFVSVVGTGGAALAYIGIATGAMNAGVVLPVLPVLGAIMLSSGLALGWLRWRGGQEIQALEKEQVSLLRTIAEKQERLAHHEAQVDRLTDDLAALREEVSTGEQRTTNLTQRIDELQTQLRTAEEQEAATRQGLKKLEAQLLASRSAAVERVSVLDKELAGLQQECEKHDIITRDVGLLSLFKVLKKIAGFRMSVLLLGEPGTGKELFAKATHAMSPRSNGPFVVVNMAAISLELFESEMFGHVKGSFTGAVRDRIGYFKQADGGTLFLDEIGDLRLDHQAKLLRVLQEGVYCRVGDGTPVKVDVRIVSATNHDLLQDIAQGRFREDLYGRLNGHEVRLPPLRQRTGDIHLLAKGLIQKFSKSIGKFGIELSTSALAAMERHPWKNNIRELERCIEKAVILTEGSHIQIEDLRFSAQEDVPAQAGQAAVPDIAPSASTGDPRKEDPALLLWLRQHSFDVQATAAALSCDRSTVTQRLKGLCFQALVRHGGDRRAAALSLTGEAGLARLVEVKIAEYADHLTQVARTYESADLAIKGCRKRFKNLPERYTAALDTLIREAFK